MQRPHLLHHHLHHRILCLMSTDTPKLQHQKEAEVRVRSYGETCSTNQQKTENTNQNEGREEVRSDLLHDLQDWLQDFREILVDESSPSEPREALRLRIETLPVLLMNFHWSREEKWNRVRASIVCTRTFRRTQIAISAGRQK